MDTTNHFTPDNLLAELPNINLGNLREDAKRLMHFCIELEANIFSFEAHGVVSVMLWELSPAGKSPWVSAYDALPAYLRSGRQQGPSSVLEVVVLEFVLFRRAGREWAGIVEAFAVVRCSLGHRAAIFPGQGVDGLDGVHSGRLFCWFWQLNLTRLDGKEEIAQCFGLHGPEVWAFTAGDFSEGVEGQRLNTIWECPANDVGYCCPSCATSIPGLALEKVND